MAYPISETLPIVTPARRSDDLAKSKLGVRDVVLLLVGAVGMYGAQVGVQWGLRSDIRDIKTSFDNYVRQQGDTNFTLQREIDEWRAETKLNRVTIEGIEKEMAELKGMMLASGVKGVRSEQR